MLEMLKARKEELQKRGKKGFTLMEMLIVIAIIAILIAIAIPIFTAQLDRANAATDEANIRSGYAQVQSDIMLSNVTSATYTLCNDAGVTRSGADDAAKEMSSPSTAGTYAAKGNRSALGEDVSIGGVDVDWSAGDTITYTVSGGKITAIGA